VSIFSASTTFSQCDEKLVEKAIKNAGTNTLFVREFKLKSEKKKSKLFRSTANFEIRLNESYLYHFNIENSAETESISILQLFDENLLLGTTYNTEKQTNEKSFDFYCEESKNYEINMSFKDNISGCAVGVLSIVLSDSLDLEQLKSDLQPENIFYTGIDNYISIATDVAQVKLKASISAGTIEEENGFYKIRVEEPGNVTVKVESTDSLGRIVESITTEFTVKESLPNISLCGKSGGIIQKNEFNFGSLNLELENIPENTSFSIAAFTVSRKLFETGQSSHATETLDYRQLNLLKSLNSGDSFFIKDIIIQNDKGLKYKLEPIGFIVE
jgi:hypothetical protein